MSEDCPPCAHAAEHGWYGPGHRGAHCRSCHRSWTAQGQLHCLAEVGEGRCCQHFASESAANLHWGSGRTTRAAAYDAVHLDPHDVALLEQDPRGVWHVARDRPRERYGACTEPSKAAPGTQVAAGAAVGTGEAL